MEPKKKKIEKKEMKKDNKILLKLKKEKIETRWNAKKENNN
jgi:hypothetical protein